MPWTEARTLYFAERTFRQEQGHLLVLEFNVAGPNGNIDLNGVGISR